MSTFRQFHIGDILSITDGRLVSPRHMDGVYDILNFMTGEDLFTHQLPRAAKACAPALLRLHPYLATPVDKDADLNAETVDEWLEKQVRHFGETLPVSPLSGGAYMPVSPMVELIEMQGVDRSRVIVVGVGKGEGG